MLCSVEIPDTVTIGHDDGSYPSDPEDWKAFGDRWIDACESAVLEVPSVIARTQKNYVLNPLHPLFAAIKMGEPTPFVLDPRLFR
jgi:RES domain-containing protein